MARSTFCATVNGTLDEVPSFCELVGSVQKPVLGVQVWPVKHTPPVVRSQGNGIDENAGKHSPTCVEQTSWLVDVEGQLPADDADPPWHRTTSEVPIAAMAFRPSLNPV